MTELVVLGCSWGGLEACERVLADIPDAADVPVVIVQHRRDAASGLAGLLGRHCAWPVVEPDDNERIVSRRVFLAPADYHLMVERGRFKLSTEGPVQHARPSVDVLFDSAASAYGAGVAGVVLTGANEDGAAGLAAIAACGGVVVVQDPAGAERPEMPAAALSAVPAARVMALDEIGTFIGILGGAGVDARR